MRALNRHVERVFNPDRKDTHWESASWREIDSDALNLPESQSHFAFVDNVDDPILPPRRG